MSLFTTTASIGAKSDDGADLHRLNKTGHAPLAPTNSLHWNVKAPRADTWTAMVTEVSVALALGKCCDREDPYHCIQLVRVHGCWMRYMNCAYVFWHACPNFRVFISLPTRVSDTPS